MVRIVEKSIFDVDADVLVNPVNCVGVMGAGLAKQFRIRYPRMYYAYRKACRNGEVKIGKPMMWVEDGKLVLNLPTKKHWRNPSRYEYIEEGLKWMWNNIGLMESVLERRIEVIAVPWLGCGLGGLEKRVVYRMVKRYLGQLDCDVLICGGKW